MIDNILSKETISRLLLVAKKAGEIAAESQGGNIIVFKKIDNSEVTNIDIEISKYISKEISIITPNIKIVCEENDVRNIDEDIFWLVDPIDGTSSFINNEDEFSINIALVKNKKAIFGIIYAPKFDGGKLAYIDHENNVILNERTISKSLSNKFYDRLRITTSKRTHDQEIKDFVKQHYGNYLNNFSIYKYSASIKFLLLLENKVDIFIALRQTMEWDTAPGQALIEALNKNCNIIFKENKNFIIKEAMLYKKNNFLNNYFIIK